jgi:hypothetical protein
LTFFKLHTKLQFITTQASHTQRSIFYPHCSYRSIEQPIGRVLDSSKHITISTLNQISLTHQPLNMRFQLLSLAAILLATASALKAQSQFLISFPNEAPQSDVDRAMDLMREAGGVIVHEYKLIKGFACKASESAIESIKTMGGQFPPLVEEDSVVKLNGKTGDNDA